MYLVALCAFVVVFVAILGVKLYLLVRGEDFVHHDIGGI